MPYGAAKRARTGPTLGGRSMRTVPLRRWVETHMGLRSARWARRSEAGTAREQRHWGVGWEHLWAHEASEGSAKMERAPRANCIAGALGGAPYGPTKRVRGAPK
eukprot:1537875-Pyramimonas_sp.AAC.1